MHPNAFLRTYWRADFRPEIFVAMSFAPAYETRFNNIIKPAIESITWQGRQLKANRVDLSKTGDSILSDIVDGIAHAEIVLADVSTIGHDSKDGTAYRNGNVMYEVGIALACRQSSEVLLVRDDKDRFLFDVSTIPHKHIDFTNSDHAKSELIEELIARLSERDHINDARIATAIASMTGGERTLLHGMAEKSLADPFYFKKWSIAQNSAIQRLLDKHLISTIGATQNGREILQLTRLGHVIATNLERLSPLIPQPEFTSTAETA